MNVEQMEALKEQKELELQQLQQRLADVQADIQTLGENIHFARNGHIRMETIARIEAERHVAHNERLDAAADRLAAQRQEQLAAEQARLEAEQRRVRQIQEREEKNLADMERKRQKLVQQGFMPA